MFENIKNLFVSKDDRELREAKEGFDRLMDKVDQDQLDLAKLEERVKDEFKGIEGDVKSIRQEVDDVMGERAA